MNISDFMKNYQPCSDSRKWIKEADIKTTEEAWNKCQRGDWLIWFLSKAKYDKKGIIKISCDIIRHQPIGDGKTVWSLLTNMKLRNAIEEVELWCEGNTAVVSVAVYDAVAADAVADYTAAKQWQADYIRSKIAYSQINIED